MHEADMPIISVITVCLNAAATIRQTIESVIRQNYENIEYIIIDGESTDETLILVGNYKEHINHITSEKDSGIYDAMNKGIDMAKGDILYFLNADDTLVDSEVFHRVANVFSNDPEVSLVYGDVIWRTGKENILSKQPDRITREFLARRTLLHQSAFMKRELFKEIGSYDIRFRVVADYKWFLEYFLRYGGRYQYISKPIAFVGVDGVSSSTDWETERLQVMSGIFSPWEIIRYRVAPQLVRWLRKVIKSARGDKL